MTAYDVRAVPQPQDDEEVALHAAVDELLAAEKRQAEASRWRLTGRVAGMRGGVLDVRASEDEKAWPASGSLPFTGQAYNGRHGRGDAK